MSLVAPSLVDTRTSQVHPSTGWSRSRPEAASVAERIRCVFGRIWQPAQRPKASASTGAAAKRPSGAGSGRRLGNADELTAGTSPRLDRLGRIDDPDRTGEPACGEQCDADRDHVVERVDGLAIRREGVAD